MGKQLINGELSVSFPESFHVMDADEEKKVFLENAAERWSIWDTEAHILLSITWHKSGKIISKLASAKDVVNNIKKKARKAYKANAYREIGDFSMQVCGLTARGFEFEHVIEDIAQVARIVVFKNGTSCYTVSYYARKGNEAANQAIFEDILNSMSIV